MRPRPPAETGTETEAETATESLVRTEQAPEPAAPVAESSLGESDLSETASHAEPAEAAPGVRARPKRPVRTGRPLAMDSLLPLLVFAVVWFLVVKFILPRLGFKG